MVGCSPSWALAAAAAAAEQDDFTDEDSDLGSSEEDDSYDHVSFARKYLLGFFLVRLQFTLRLLLSVVRAVSSSCFHRLFWCVHVRVRAARAPFYNTAKACHDIKILVVISTDHVDHYIPSQCILLTLVKPSANDGRERP